MKISVIFIDDEVTGTAKASVVYCLTFIFEGNPKFHLDVCENKDVIFFPIYVHKTPEFYPHISTDQYRCNLKFLVAWW